MNKNGKETKPVITRKQAHENPEKQQEIDENNPIDDRPYGLPARSNELPKTPIGQAVGPRIAGPGNNPIPPFSLENSPFAPTAPTAEELNRLSLNLAPDAEDVDFKEQTPSDTESDRSATPDIEMATPQVVTLRDALAAIPELDGSNIPLEDFLEGCRDAKSMIVGGDEGTLVKFLKLRIKGEAKRAIRDEICDNIATLETYLKKIFIPSQTVPQLLGELGRQYQRDNESVLAFANRVRGIGTRVLEAQKAATAAEVSEDFKTAVTGNIIDCFKRGLRPEIENKVTVGDNVTNLVQSAIVAEKKLAARELLRQGPTPPPRTKKVMANQPESNGTKPKISCEYCKMTNHGIDKCFKKQRDEKPIPKSNNTVCQLCDLPGHLAKQCNTIEICQLCNQTGHAAKQCFKRNAAMVVCQICNKPGHLAKDCFAAKNNATKPQAESTQIKTCNYCKKPGHFIAECRKRLFNQSKNSSGSPQVSAPRENLPQKTRSTNFAREETLDELLLQLLPRETIE